MFKKTSRIAAWMGAILVLLAACAYVYYLSLGIDQISKANKLATVASLDYMQRTVPVKRGKILAVVSSTERMDDGKKKAGYELTELARAYFVFKANGFDVDIASPLGGKPLAVLDDMGDSDYAFLNDKEAQAKAASTLKLANIDPSAYAAVYFVGGKGAMFDLPVDPDVARIVAAIAPRGVVGAVCHGPAALLNVKLADGRPLMAGRKMTAVSNDEELFLRKNAREVFPFLLEDKANNVGARFVKVPLFLDNTVIDGRLVTGQNPWSTWSTAEGMITALGYKPVQRATTAEEYSVRLLATYYRDGLDKAKAEQKTVPQFDKMLLLMHALVAGMEWRAIDAFNLQRLANP